MLKYFPSPNAVPTNAFTNANNFFNTGKGRSTDDRFDSRLDHNFSGNFRLWARGSFSGGLSTPFNGFGNLGTSLGQRPVRQQQLQYRSELRIHVQPEHHPECQLRFRAEGQIIPIHFQAVLILDFALFPGERGAGSFEHISSFPARISRATIGVLAGPIHLHDAPIQAYSHDLRTDLTKVHGSHNFMVGAEERVLFMNFRQHGSPSGSYTFNNAWTQRQVGAASSTTQGAGMASFLLGYLGGGSLEHTMAIASSSQYYGFYARDDWRVSRKLTLNIGLRWDVDLPRTERYNRLSYWDPDAPSPIAGKVPEFPNLKGAMMFTSPDHRRQTPTDMNNWGPRFGFAYQFEHKTVLRGAYGILYSPSVLQASGTSGSSARRASPDRPTSTPHSMAV